MLLRKLVTPDVMHVISFTRLPRFSRATLKSLEEPGYEARLVLGLGYVILILCCYCNWPY